MPCRDGDLPWLQFGVKAAGMLGTAGQAQAVVTSSLQYFIGVTVLAMVPELPEIVNGIQFALQNNLSLR